MVAVDAINAAMKESLSHIQLWIAAVPKPLVPMLLLASAFAWAGSSGAQNSDLQAQVEHCKSLEDDQPADAEQLAIEIYDQALLHANQQARIEALGCMGWSQARQGQLKQARESARRMADELAEAGLPAELAMGLTRRVGGVFHQAGDRIAAAEYYADALSLGVANGLKSEQIPLLVNLAVLHSEFEDHERAIEHYEQALGLMEELQDFRYQPPVLFNLALTLNGQGYHDRALNYLERTEQLIDENWPAVRVVQVYSAKSTALLELERFDEALTYADRAIERAGELGRSGALGGALSSKAEVLSQTGRDNEAVSLAERSVGIARELEDVYQLRGAIATLATIYERLGRADAALPLVKELREIDQELSNSANTERLAEMEAILDDAKQREELIELRYQAQVQKLELEGEREFTRYGLIAGGFLMAGVLLIVLWQRQMNRKLHHRSMTDTLTQLPNRRRLMEWLNQHPTSDAARVIWLMDLDRFKTVNDRFGHESGDALLREIGHHLATLNSRTRIIGRWGGEEFLAVTDDVEVHDIELFAEQLRGAVSTAQITVLDDQFISVTTSIGHAVVAQDNYWEAALNQADGKLYGNKKKGH